MNKEYIKEGDSVIENNKLIAEFMGVQIGVDNYSWRIGVTEKLREDHLNYHASWEWLEPVVQKISDIEKTPPPNYTSYRVEIVYHGYVKISNLGQPEIFKSVSHSGGLLNAVYLAVIDFIKFYNKKN